MSNNTDPKIQETEQRNESRLKHINIMTEDTCIDLHNIAYLLSEIERLQDTVDMQQKVIEHYQQIEKDMESDYMQILELIKKNELCTHTRITATYKLAEEALSHLKG